MEGMGDFDTDEYMGRVRCDNCGILDHREDECLVTPKEGDDN